MKQTHTYIVRLPKDDAPGDCMLCGSEIVSGDLCEETRIEGETIYDDEISYCCRLCTEAECTEEYKVAEESTESCVFCSTMNAQARHSRTCFNR